MKQLIICLLLFLVFSCSNETTPTKGQASENLPNIVYILADDLGYGDISAYNPQSQIKTTHLDQLAKEGMRLTDVHSPSSVCTPTRYGILTGRYCWRSRLPQGVLRGYGRALLEPGRRTVANLLKEKGYTTGVVGKWHLGLDWVLKKGHEDALEAAGTQTNEVGMVQDMNPEFIDFTKKPTDGPLDHGFDYSYILPASLDMEPYCYLENDILTAIPSEYTPGNDLNTGYTEAFWRAGKMAPEFEFDQVLPTFKKKAVRFIETQVKNKTPFFLYLPLAAPHTPWVPTDDFKDAANAGNYGDFVKMVDEAVGQILQAIDQVGAKDNTLVIFTSDNGPFWTPALIEKFNHRSAGALRGMKADAWEGGHRIPYIARWPGTIPANSNSPALTSLTHLFATVADLLNIDIQPGEGEDSHSLLPVLKGQSQQIANQQAVVHHSSRGLFAIRKGDWKLIQGRGSGGFSEPRVYDPLPGEPIGQLYNLKNDVRETNNLYESHLEKVTELNRLLKEIKNSNGKLKMEN